MPLHHIKSHYNLILYYTSTYVERVSQHDNACSFIVSKITFICSWFSFTCMFVMVITKVVSLYPSQVGYTRYNIMHYVIKFVSDMAGQWFSPGTPVSSTNKTDRHDITEILLKVVLNTITLVKVVVLYQGPPFTQIFLHTLTLNNLICLAIRTLIISEVSNYKDPLSCFPSL